MKTKSNRASLIKKRRTYKKRKNVVKKYMGGVSDYSARLLKVMKAKPKHIKKIENEIENLQKTEIDDNYNFKTDEDSLKRKVVYLIGHLNVYTNLYTNKNTVKDFSKNAALYNIDNNYDSAELQKKAITKKAFEKIIDLIEDDFKEFQKHEFDNDKTNEDDDETTNLLPNTSKKNENKNSSLRSMSKSLLGSISKFFSKL